MKAIAHKYNGRKVLPNKKISKYALFLNVPKLLEAPAVDKNDTGASIKILIDAFLFCSAKMIYVS